MSSSEVAQGAPEVGAAPEGAQGPVADVQEVVTATTDGAKPESEKDAEQKRLAKLAFEAREAKRLAKAAEEAREREKADYERQLAELREGKGAAPKPEDFESYDEYLEKRQDWLLDQKLKEREKAGELKAREAKQAEEKARRQTLVESVVTKGAESFKDFDATLQALNSAIDPADFREGLDAALESDKAADILYYLGKNPSFAIELSSKSPREQVKAIGRLEERFASKKLTAAPALVEPLKGNGGRVTSDKAPTDPAEYRKWRAKQKRA
jgi:hypothetical protein